MDCVCRAGKEIEEEKKGEWDGMGSCQVHVRVLLDDRGERGVLKSDSRCFLPRYGVDVENAERRHRVSWYYLHTLLLSQQQHHLLCCAISNSDTVGYTLAV